jgi:hypothetical protein
MARKSLLILVLISLGVFCAFFPRSLAAQTQPDPKTLPQNIFVYGVWELDHDYDGLRDSEEHRLAEHFKPYLIFDSDEADRRDYEPRTLFQVRPMGCIGSGCPTPWRLHLVFAFLFARDGGYGPDSDCFDDHNGDNERAHMILNSYDGQTWSLERVFVANGNYTWPDNTDAFFMGSHMVIYMSAHKHHMYVHTYHNHSNSIYSECGCNDDVNGLGDQIWPDLVSPLADQRVNNVGEPDAHFTQYFINGLDEFGYPGEHTWSNAHFKGGLGDDGGKTSSLLSMWVQDPFQFGPGFPTYEPLGTISGYVTDGQGHSIDGLMLYIRGYAFDDPDNLGGLHSSPWTPIPVDGNGFYQVQLRDGVYWIRPAASRYNFYNVPYMIELGSNDSFEKIFTGERILSWNPANRPLPQVVTGLEEDVPLEDDSDTLGPEFTFPLTVVDPGAADITFPPAQMATVDGSGDSEVIDHSTQLPKRAIVSLVLRTVLDSDGNPAQSSVDTAFGPPFLFIDPMGNRHTFPGEVILGEMVSNAEVRARLVTGENLRPLRFTGWVEGTTDSRGRARWLFVTGKHPGWAQIELEIVSNPANPWLVGVKRSAFVEIQPGGGANGDDDTHAIPSASLQKLPSFNPRIAAILGELGTLSYGDRPVLISGDLNLDRLVDLDDLALLRDAMGTREGLEGYWPLADLNGDGLIDRKDEKILERLLKKKKIKKTK